MHYRLTGSFVFHLCTILLSLHSPTELRLVISLSTMWEIAIRDGRRE